MTNVKTGRGSYVRKKVTLNVLRQLTRPTYLWTRFINHPIGILVAWACIKVGIGARTLTVLTAIPVLFSVYALYTFPTPWNLFWFMIAIQFSYVMDCADGPEARATHAASAPGAFLDRLIDFFSLAVIGVSTSHYIVLHISNHDLILWSAVVYFITRALSYSAQFMKPQQEGPMAPLSRRFVSRIFGELTDTGLWWFLLPLVLWKPSLWWVLAAGALLNLLVYLKALATAYRENIPVDQ